MLTIQQPYYLSRLGKSYHAGPPTSKHVPIHGGLWIRNITENEEGSLGCVVSTGGTVYILTAQHVAIPAGTPPNNLDVVTQPPYEFAGARKVGTVTSILPPPAGSVLPPTADPYAVKNAPVFTDAALIAISDASYSYEIPGVGIPTGVTTPKAGMQVKMNGARTGYHEGVITDPDVKIIAKDSQTGNWLIVSHVVAYDMFHDSGDSGSVVLEKGTNKAVCMTEGVATFNGGQQTIRYGTRLDYLAQVWGLNFVGREGIFGVEKGTVPGPSPTDPYPGLPSTDIGPIIIVGGGILAGYIISQIV